jgi:hypothetical protein
MAPLAIEVKRLGEPRLATLIVESVAFRALLVFGGFVFHQLAVLIKVVAPTTLFNPGGFIMGFMVKKGWRSLGVFENGVVHKLHILLGLRNRNQDNGENHQHQDIGKVWFHFHHFSMTS